MIQESGRVLTGADVLLTALADYDKGMDAGLHFARWTISEG